MSILGLVSSDRDDVRRANDQLLVDCGQAQEELKRLRGAVEQMSREYEDSKELDFIRRYGVLKRIVKRTIMHLTLSNEDNIQSAAAAAAAASASRGKRTDANVAGLSTQDLAEENDELAIQIKECRQRTSMIRLLIEELERNYEDSKRFIVVQRYRLMKAMIKTITHSSLR